MKTFMLHEGSGSGFETSQQMLGAAVPVDTALPSDEDDSSDKATECPECPECPADSSQQQQSAEGDGIAKGTGPISFAWFVPVLGLFVILLCVIICRKRRETRYSGKEPPRSPNSPFPMATPDPSTDGGQYHDEPEYDSDDAPDGNDDDEVAQNGVIT